MQLDEINNYFGDIDLLLMDSLLKGLIPVGGRVLDAGCGSGRNLLYFLQHGYQVYAVDQSPNEIKTVKFIAQSLKKEIETSVADVGQLPYSDDFFDFIICSRVLHFAADQASFWQMVDELWRTLSADGRVYLVMDSAIGMEDHISQVDESKHQFPDGSERFLFNEQLMQKLQERWELVAQPRTILFERAHAETTLLLKKKPELI